MVCHTDFSILSVTFYRQFKWICPGFTHPEAMSSPVPSHLLSGHHLRWSFVLFKFSLCWIVELTTVTKAGSLACCCFGLLIHHKLLTLMLLLCRSSGGFLFWQRFWRRIASLSGTCTSLSETLRWTVVILCVNNKLVAITEYSFLDNLCVTYNC